MAGSGDATQGITHRRSVWGGLNYFYPLLGVSVFFSYSSSSFFSSLFCITKRAQKACCCKIRFWPSPLRRGGYILHLLFSLERFSHYHDWLFDFFASFFLCLSTLLLLLILMYDIPHVFFMVLRAMPFSSLF